MVIVPKWGLLFGLFLLCGTIAASPGESDSPPVILVVGDSLSAAYGMPVTKGWVHLLASRLDRAGFPHRVINASVSGETSRGALERLPSLLKRHTPELVIIELGGNDGLRGLSLEQLAQNLSTMVERARAAGARVLLVGMQMPPNYGPEYTGRFAAVYREVAERHRVALVPFLLEGVAGERMLMQSDGMHAAAPAQPQLLENVWEHLEPLLKEDTTGAKARPKENSAPSLRTSP